MTIRPVRHEELPKLQQLAAEDGHHVVGPTHVAVKDGDIVGYFSMGSIPMILTWLSTKHVVASDSLKNLRQIEATATINGHPVICIPCATDSPFYQHMEKLGYIEAPMMRFFFKRLI